MNTWNVYSTSLFDRYERKSIFIIESVKETTVCVLFKVGHCTMSGARVIIESMVYIW